MMFENDKVRGWLRQVNPGDTDEGFPSYSTRKSENPTQLFFIT